MSSAPRQAGHRNCTTVVNTLHLPARDRLIHFQQALSHAHLPVEVLAERAPDHRARVRTVPLGTLTATSMWHVGPGRYEIRRTPALIRAHDPEVFRLVVHLAGPNRFSQGDHDITLHPRDLALYDSSRPFRMRWNSGRLELLMLTFPRELSSLPAEALHRLCGTRLDGRTAIGTLVSGLAIQLVRDAHSYRPTEASRLSTAFLDMLTILLGQYLNLPPGAPDPGEPRRTLLLTAQTYIQHHLADADLSPRSVAAAQHVSIRSLNRAFAQEGLTIAGWIRRSRLDRCRQALADPSLRTVPVHVIAARHGFPNAAHFSRVFHAAHDLGPQEYRTLALRHLEGQPGRPTGRSRRHPR